MAEPGGMIPARWLLLPLAAAAIVAGITFVVGPSGGGVKSVRSVAPVPVAAALAGTDSEIASLKARLATPAGDMIDHESLAMAWLARAKLTGSFADLLKARDAARAGIDMSPPGTGPWLAKAAAEFSGHRIAEAEAALDRVDRFVVPTAETKAEARAVRSDIALVRGDLAGAARLLDEAARIDQWPGLYARLGQLARVRGDYDAAENWFVKADTVIGNPSARSRADTVMWRGDLALARGDYEGAAMRFREIESIFPGWWRTSIKLAQLKALKSDFAGATTDFETLAKRTGLPEPMDRLAALYRLSGDRPRSESWAARAREAWRARLAQLPEAAWGHAAEHELAFGDVKIALSLAGRDARNRPSGESLILLAKAWLANGRADYAHALLARARRQGWQSADLWMTDWQALVMLGRATEAQAAREAALTLNPGFARRNAALAWFDH